MPSLRARRRRRRRSLKSENLPAWVAWYDEGRESELERRRRRRRTEAAGVGGCQHAVESRWRTKEARRWRCGAAAERARERVRVSTLEAVIIRVDQLSER